MMQKETGASGNISPETGNEAFTSLRRPSGRNPDQGRPVAIKTGFSPHAEGSALIEVGGTKVLCNASLEQRVPPFLRGKGKGWITAEYGMLPRSTHSRSSREAAKGKQSGRTQEIQRLIGRSLRACVDLSALGECMITLDCDVLNADGGTRCAAVTGAWVALALALARIGKISALHAQIAAVSCGLTQAGAVLDLDYQEDSSAFADTNFVLAASTRDELVSILRGYNTVRGGIVEIQGTAEDAPFSYNEFSQLFSLAQSGVLPLFAAQKQAFEQAFEQAARQQ